MQYQNSVQQPRQQNYNSRPSATIRDGLSVQELKVMTAMRMAQNNEPPKPVVSNSISNNPASSYQTATPQQLQAAGIQPVIINDRTTTNVRQTRPTATRSTVVGIQNISALNGNLRSEIVGRGSSLNELSPYHQQLFSRNNANASSSISTAQQVQNRAAPRQSMFETRQPSNNLSQNGNWIQTSDMSHSNLTDMHVTQSQQQRLQIQNSDSFPRRNFLEADRLVRARPMVDMGESQSDMMRRPTINGNNNTNGQRMFDSRSNVQSQNDTMIYSRGPEVRTPVTVNHEFSNGLEWDRELVIPQQQSLQRNTTLPMLEVSPSKLVGTDLILEQQNRSRILGIQSVDPMQGTINSIGSIKSKLLKSNSQPTIPLEEFASLVINNSNSSHHHQSSPFLELPREMSPASSSLVVSQSEKSPSKFPMIKSKTAPRLSVSPNDLLPAISPTKSNSNISNMIPGKPINRESNFLPNEVAESVLDVLSPFPSLSNSGKHRQSNNSGSDFSFNQGGFFAGTDMNDPRFSWEEAE